MSEIQFSGKTFLASLVATVLFWYVVGAVVRNARPWAAALVARVDGLLVFGFVMCVAGAVGYSGTCHHGGRTVDPAPMPKTPDYHGMSEAKVPHAVEVYKAQLAVWEREHAKGPRAPVTPPAEPVLPAWLWPGFALLFAGGAALTVARVVYCVACMHTKW